MRRAAWILAIASALGACSTLGSPASSPEGLPHGGTGPYRVLGPDELDVPPTPPGSTLRELSRAVESGMVADGHLFYAGARALPVEEPDAGPIDDGGVPDGGVADGGVDDAGVEDAGADDAGVEDAGPVDAGPRIATPDWSLFEPRSIFHSAPRTNGQLGFDAGDEVLAAAETWEGGLVHDPWALVLPDGRALLYYAAEGGIGVAQASSIDGSFARVGDGRILDVPGARRPAVIRTEGTTATRPFLMYVEIEGTIHALESDDALAWDDLGAITISYVDENGPVDAGTLPARDDRDSIEVGVGSPGALAAHTPAGRRIVRLYFESRRADGQVLLAMAGSFDGRTFEGLSVPIFDGRVNTFPAPRQIDDRITMLYMITPYRDRNALIAGVAPAGVTLGSP